MAIYAIGDIQGCYAELKALLSKINFKQGQDDIWLVGDLVNRGPDSLSVLRLLVDLDPSAVVLGNHDLHLLAVYHGAVPMAPGDTLEHLLAAEDIDELMAWLQAKPLLHVDDDFNYCMSHAGLAPMWDLDKTIVLAGEVNDAIQGPDALAYFEKMYGNTPNLWSDDLQGMERLRCITNYLTRMRLCDADGRLDFDHKGLLADAPKHLMPWFDHPVQLPKNMELFFGHWAAIQGDVPLDNVWGLDLGCVWGGPLMAMRLEDKQCFCVPHGGS